MQDFTDTVAVVTGSANPRGIGIAIARRFATLGCRVVLADLDGEGAEQRAGELRACGTDAIALATDMGDHASVVALADSTYDLFGATHVLVLTMSPRPADRAMVYSTPIRRRGSFKRRSNCWAPSTESRRSFRA